jgi:hypothetical protein
MNYNSEVRKATINASSAPENDNIFPVIVACDKPKSMELSAL